MSSYQVIAIDGPAASGKSSVGKKLAGKLGIHFVSSGMMYRVLTWKVAREGIDFEDQASIIDLLPSLEVVTECIDGHIRAIVNGENPGDAITSTEVNNGVSKVAKIPEVRKILVKLQRACRDAADIVMEGRDIGSVVFPDSPYKFYLDASEEVRQARRQAQGLEDSISERDKDDSKRKTSPLVIAEGATVVDTSDLNLDQVVDVVHAKVLEKGFVKS